MASKTKTTTKPAAPKAAETPRTIRVRATRHLSEAGIHYPPGTEFETTAARAKALGRLVETV